MSFEQPVYSFNASSGEPPTPTRTPSSPNFFNNSYQTPKQDSKFHDPLSPWPATFGSSPLFSLTPHTAHTPPANGDFTSTLPGKSKTVEDVASEIAARAQFTASDSKLPLAPVDTSRQLPSSPQPSLQIDTNASDTTIPKSDTTPVKDRHNEAASESMNSAGSIQTPPPTSTSTSRRKASEAQVAKSTRVLASKGDTGFTTSTEKKDEATTGKDQQVDESPSTHFPNLQFSPDGLGFPLSGGPATAPVYPQHKLFWDSEQSMDAMNLDFPMDDTFTNFGLGLQKHLEPFVSEHDLTARMHAPTSQTFNVGGSSAISDIAGATAPRHSVALNQTNISPSVAIMTQGSSRSQYTTTVVNPSLLFSSPNTNPLSSSERIQDNVLKPYAHQIQDAEYEKELQSRRPKRKRGAELDSPAVKAATQALRGAEDRSSADSSDTTVVASFGGSIGPSSRHSRNRSSHLRNVSRGDENLSNSIDSGKRTSVTLTIDENGRAKTETKLVEATADQPISSRMNIDGESSSSESESSSSRSSQGLAFSQPSSFAYPVERQKRSKTPGSQKGHSIQGSHHSHHSSYASTFGSNNVPAYDSQRKNHSNLRKSSQPQVHFEDSTSFVGGTLAEVDSEAETIVDTDDDKGNAASELKKVVRQRSNQKLRTNSLPRQSFADHRVLPNTHSHPYYTQQSTTTPSRLGSSQTQQNISPTTITDPDMATPSTGGRTGLSVNSITRCVCNVNEGDGQLMVQCDSCKKWLHLECVGLNQRNIPEIYLCIFCNHDTPKGRGTRREPARAAFPPPSSPLAYKS